MGWYRPSSSNVIEPNQTTIMEGNHLQSSGLGNYIKFSKFPSSLFGNCASGTDSYSYDIHLNFFRDDDVVVESYSQVHKSWRTGSCLPFGNCKCYYLYFVKCLFLFLFVCSVVALVLSLFCPEGYPV